MGAQVQKLTLFHIASQENFIFILRLKNWISAQKVRSADYDVNKLLRLRQCLSVQINGYSTDKCANANCILQVRRRRSDNA